jgi:hypothetical protein
VAGVPLTVEFESVSGTTYSAGDSLTVRTSDVLFNASAAGDWIMFPVSGVFQGTYDINVTLEKGLNRVIVRLESSDSPNGNWTTHGTQDTYGGAFQTVTPPFGVNTPIDSTGTRYFRFWITGTTGNSGWKLAVNQMTLTPK